MRDPLGDILIPVHFLREREPGELGATAIARTVVAAPSKRLPKDVPGTDWNVLTFETNVPHGSEMRTYILMQFADGNSSLSMERALDISAQLCWMVKMGYLVPKSGGQLSVEIITWNQSTKARHFTSVCGPVVDQEQHARVHSSSSHQPMSMQRVAYVP